MNDTTLYFLAAEADKASPSRPELLPGKLPGAAYEVRDLATGETVTLSYDSVTVGAGSLATATCSVSMYGVLARALRYAGCTREAVARLVTEATAAELRGDADADSDSDAVKALVETLRAAFAVALPRVPRAGGVTVKGARFEAAEAAAEAAAAK
jgi:hypothetical protein